MAPQKEKQMRRKLLRALFEARKRVVALEAALAHHDSLLGEGVDRESLSGGRVPDPVRSVKSLLHDYIGLIEPKEDISDFIGREGHDESRPRLGPDAPPEVRPDKPAPLSPLVGNVVREHPDDSLALPPGDPADAPPVTVAAVVPKQEEEAAGTDPSREAGFSPDAAGEVFRNLWPRDDKAVAVPPDGRPAFSAAFSRREADQWAGGGNLYFLAEELRAPLNGILDALRMLEGSSLSAAQTEWVLAAGAFGQNLAGVIADLSDLSRIEAGSFALVPRLFDFSATVRSTLGMFLHEAEQKKLRFNLKLGETIPGLLTGDDLRVRRILIHLVGNAFRFTEQGEVSVECALLPCREAGRQRIFLAVEDTGKGMPEDFSRPVARIAGSGVPRYAGSGPGLAVACGLVNLMGGDLEVESLAGEGTIAHCSLLFDQPRPAPDSPSASGEKFNSAGPLDILVVEDDPVNQFALRRMLQRAGHTPVCVGNGRQALEALLLRPFSCVITDIQMPVMDGVELMERIRSGNTAGIEPGPEIGALLGAAGGAGRAAAVIDRDIPMVALTTRTVTENGDPFMGMGMDYCLTKPLFAAKLAVILGRIGMLLHARGKR